MSRRHVTSLDEELAESASVEVKRADGDELLLVGRGAWDFSHLHGPRRNLVEVIERAVDARPGLRQLHLDLTQVSILDSSGLSVLVLLHRRLVAHDAALRVAATDRVRRRLALTGVDRLFAVD